LDTNSSGAAIQIEIRAQNSTLIFSLLIYTLNYTLTRIYINILIYQGSRKLCDAVVWIAELVRVKKVGN